MYCTLQYCTVQCCLHGFLYSAPHIILDLPYFRPLTPVFGHLLPNLLWCLLALVLKAILTFLIWYLSTPWHLYRHAVFVRYLLTLFPILVVHMTFLSVGGFTFLLGLRVTNLLVLCVAVRGGKSLTVLLILVVYQDIVIAHTDGTFLYFPRGWYEYIDRFTHTVRDVSACLLWDSDTLGDLLGSTFLLGYFPAFFLLHIVTPLLGYLDTVLTMVGGSMVCGSFVYRLALLPVLSVTHFLLFLVTDISVCGLTLLLILVLTFYIALMFALGFDDILTFLFDGWNTGLHIVIPATTPTQEIHHIICSTCRQS